MIPNDLLIGTFARIHQLALALAVGIVAGAFVFLATAVLLLKGGDVIGPNLQLLGQYIPGYSVSWPGSLIGAAGGFALGAAVGWTAAFLRNMFVALYVYLTAFRGRLGRFLDEI